MPPNPAELKIMVKICDTKTYYYHIIFSHEINDSIVTFGRRQSMVAHGVLKKKKKKNRKALTSWSVCKVDLSLIKIKDLISLCVTSQSAAYQRLTIMHNRSNIDVLAPRC